MLPSILMLTLSARQTKSDICAKYIYMHTPKKERTEPQQLSQDQSSTTDEAIVMPIFSSIKDCGHLQDLPDCGTCSSKKQ